MDSAKEFADKILKGMGFDLELIGDVPMHVEADITARENEIARAAAEAMRENIAKGFDNLHWTLKTNAEAAACVRTIPLPAAGDAPSDEEEGGGLDNCVLCAKGVRHRTCVAPERTLTLADLEPLVELALKWESLETENPSTVERVLAKQECGAELTAALAAIRSKR